MYLQDYERYLGTGEKNPAGLELKTFLEDYDPKRYDCPANTVDNVIFSYVEKNGKKNISKVLLIKRGNHPSIGWWAMPGGFVDFRENLDVAAARELEEETGLAGVKGVAFATYGDYDRDPRTRIITTAYVFVEAEGRLNATAGDDAADAGWFNIDVVKQSETVEHKEENIVEEFYDMIFTCGQVMATATVKKTIDSSQLLQKIDYKVVKNNLIAADHAAIILNALDYVNERL